jgi:hypothetical protein
VRRLLWVATVLVALGLTYLVVDLLTKSYVEGRVEDEFRGAAQVEADEVSFSMDSFPFLAKLAFSSEVSATLELEGVEDRGVTIDRFILEVDALTFDRDSAFAGDVEVTGVDQATVSLDLGASAISDLIGLPVEIRGDGTVLVDGVDAQVTMDGDALSVQGATIDLNLQRYFPCSPEVDVQDDFVHLGCTTDELPRIVNRIIGQAINR